MRNIVLKTPTLFFTIGVLAPLLILAYQGLSEESIIELSKLKVIIFISSIIKLIWFFSIVDYFQSKLDEYKHLKLVYFLLTFDALLTAMNFFIIDSPNPTIEISLYLLPLAVHITTTVFVTNLIHKVFYERSIWFIAIEIFTSVVGIITLTPEIKKQHLEQQLSNKK